MSGLGAWYSGLLTTREQKQAAVRQFLADVGDIGRLTKVYMDGGTLLGSDHPDVRALWSHIEAILAAAKKAVPEIDAAISRAVQDRSWPWEPLTFDAWFNGSTYEEDTRGLTGWPLAAAIVVLVVYMSHRFFDPAGVVQERTILAKARAAAIMREVEARGKAIEAGRTPGGPSPFDQPQGAALFNIDLDWKIPALFVVGYLVWKNRRAS